MQYSKYGYTFKAQQMDNGDWCACGHAAGKKPYVLHKLGSRLTEEDMQKALVSWAKHVLAVPVRVPAVMSPEGAAVAFLFVHETHERKRGLVYDYLQNEEKKQLFSVSNN